MAFADALSILGAIELARHRYEAAEKNLRDAIRAAVEIPHLLTQLYATESLARCLLSQGRKLQAEGELVAVLPLIPKVGHSAAPEPLATLAEVYRQTDRHHAAVLILSLSASVASSTGYDPYPVLADQMQRSKSQLKLALTDSEFDAAWKAGAGLTIDQAISYALTALDHEVAHQGPRDALPGT